LSSCSSVVNGKRCEISCNTPLVAQCVKATEQAGPACFCQ
jgi:hypothetical protein